MYTEPAQIPQKKRTASSKVTQKINAAVFLFLVIIASCSVKFAFSTAAQHGGRLEFKVFQLVGAVRGRISCNLYTVIAVAAPAFYDINTLR